MFSVFAFDEPVAMQEGGNAVGEAHEPSNLISVPPQPCVATITE